MQIDSQAKGGEAAEQGKQVEGPKFMQIPSRNIPYMFAKVPMPDMFYREGSTYKELKEMHEGKMCQWVEIEDIEKMQAVQKGMDDWFEGRQALEDKKQMALKGKERFEKEKKEKTLKGMLCEQNKLKEKIKAAQIELGLDESSGASSSRTEEPNAKAS